MATVPSNEEFERRFRSVYFSNFTPVLDLSPGDYFIALVAPDRVRSTSKTKHTMTGASGDKFFSYQAVTKITEDDARFILEWWQAYRVWLIHGLDGLNRCRIETPVQLPLLGIT